MVGSGGAERLSWWQHKRQERDMGRQSAYRGTYLNTPLWDCDRNPGGERVLCEFLGVR
jgi:hypothetical protein